MYELADGKWRGSITWTDPDGTRHRRYVRGATSAEAREALDKLRERLRLGILEPAGTGTLGEYLTGWIERYRLRVRPNTWRGFEGHVRVYLVPALGRIPLTRLTGADVERALASFQKAGRPSSTPRRGRPVAPVSAQTAFLIRATLRRALSDAVKAGIVGRNAASEAAAPYVPAREVEYLDATAARRLLETTRDDELGPLYALATLTGMRQGELLGLTWADVNIAERSVRIRNAMGRDAAGGRSLGPVKTTRSRRTLPLPALAAEALERVLARQAAARLAAGSAWQDRLGLVFTDELGRPISPHALAWRFRRALKAAGIEHVPFHALRHSAATLMLAEGIPLKVISEWLGHSGLAITDKHYAAIVPELNRQAAAAMDRALGGVS